VGSFCAVLGSKCAAILGVCIDNQSFRVLKNKTIKIAQTGSAEWVGCNRLQQERPACGGAFSYRLNDCFVYLAALTVFTKETSAVVTSLLTGRSILL
jgi:hypothetical protein